jgi:hypothetical protein
MILIAIDIFSGGVLAGGGCPLAKKHRAEEGRASSLHKTLLREIKDFPFPGF